MSHSRISGCAIALVDERKILFVRQFRSACGCTTLELPGGIPNHGESIVDCAVREMEEEAGFIVTDPVQRAILLTSPTTTPEYNALVCATEYSRSSIVPEFEATWIEIDEIPSLLERETIPAFDLAAISLLRY